MLLLTHYTNVQPQGYSNVLIKKDLLKNKNKNKEVT